MYITVQHKRYSRTYSIMESNSQKRKRIKKEGAEKVYEDDRWLIVRPFTIEASNIYGTNTRWCTVRDIKPGNVDNISESLFYGYTASGGVYYIIDKSTSSRDNKARKIGLHKNWESKETWYDATNTTLTSKEISSFKDRLNPGMVDSIYHNWNLIKPTTIEKLYLNPIDTIKEYSNNNLSHYIAKVVIKHEAVPKIIIILILLINFIIVSPILLIVYLIKSIKKLF